MTRDRYAFVKAVGTNAPGKQVNGACGGATVVFEVDTPETQAQKLAALARAELSPTVATRYVGCNFVDESPWAKLEQAGFDRTKPFVCTWEGVTCYLPEHVVVDFLTRAGEVMAGNARACLVLDVILQDKHVELPLAAANALEATGEPWLSFYPANFADYLQRRNVPLLVCDQVNLSRAGLVMLVPIT